MLSDSLISLPSTPARLSLLYGWFKLVLLLRVSFCKDHSPRGSRTHWPDLLPQQVYWFGISCISTRSIFSKHPSANQLGQEVSCLRFFTFRIKVSVAWFLILPLLENPSYCFSSVAFLHIFASGYDQFVANVLRREGELHQVHQHRFKQLRLRPQNSQAFQVIDSPPL